MILFIILDTSRLLPAERFGCWSNRLATSSSALLLLAICSYNVPYTKILKVARIYCLRRSYYCCSYY